MKRTFLILVIFLVLDCCWAKKKDAHDLLLNQKDANSFLVNKRDRSCKDIQDYAQMIRDIGWSSIAAVGLFIPNANVKEECCAEGCDAEEMDENMNPTPQSWLKHAEKSREYFMKYCC